MEAAFEVVVDGTDVSSRFRPLLESLTITRAAARSTDSLSIVLSDVDGMTAWPSERATVEVRVGQTSNDVGWAFSGFVTESRSRGDKDSGRTLAINASSADQHSDVKSPATRSLDDLHFADVARQWGAKVGLNVDVIGSAAEIHRDYWLQQNESYMAWGQRMARELGLTFKVIGDRAFFSPRNEGVSVSGRPLPTIEAAWGRNLIDWDIAPASARPRFSEARGAHYDLFKAQWVETIQNVVGATVPAPFRSAFPFSSEATAEQGAKAASKESEREKGGGTVTILGDHAAEPEATCRIAGARPGVDGEYTIDELTHSLAKGGGFTTQLTLKRPDGSAGVDER